MVSIEPKFQNMNTQFGAQFNGINTQIGNMNTQFSDINTTLRSIQASLHKLENQVGELLKNANDVEPTIEIPFGNNNEDEKSNGEKEVEKDFGVLEVERVEKVAPISLEQAFGIKVNQHTKHKWEVSGIIEDVGRRLMSFKNPPMLGLDNSQIKIFP